MLSLNLRTARLNQDHSGKTHEKDGEVTKLLTFGLDEVELDPSEVGVLTREPHAARALFNDDKGVLRPIFTCFKPMQLAEKIKDAYVLVRLTGGVEYKFTGCTLSKIRLALEEGGKVILSCKVQCAPALDKGFAKFIDAFGDTAEVELRGEPPGAQADLPLNRHGEGEQPEGGKTRGRRKGGDGATAH